MALTRKPEEIAGLVRASLKKIVEGISFNNAKRYFDI